MFAFYAHNKIHSNQITNATTNTTGINTLFTNHINHHTFVTLALKNYELDKMERRANVIIKL